MGRYSKPPLEVVVVTYMITEKIDANRCGVNFQTDEGVLVEMDNNYWQEEDFYFEDPASNAHFTLKDSQADDADQENSVSLKAFQQFEEKEKTIGSIINGCKDWNTLNQYLDTDSLIYFYITQELTESIDAAQSSMFLYQDGADDKIHFGPLWDYDNSMGNMSDQTTGAWLTRESRKNQRINWFTELRKIPEFNKRVGEIYREKIVPSLNHQIQAIDGKQQTLALSGNMNYHRYRFLGNLNAIELGSHESYADAVQEVKDWLVNRKAYFDGQFTGVHVGYNAHLSGFGWQDYKVDGEEAGTTGQSRRMEAIAVYLNSSDIAGNIEARSYVDGTGWLGWKTDGQFTGSTGLGKSLQAVDFRLSGDIAEQYDIYYRTHVANIGWMGWTKNGKSAGTIGYDLPIEALQIKVLPKDIVPEPDDSTIPPFKKKNISYSGHVENIGWMKAVGEGEICGTTGSSLRIEALKLQLNTPDYEGDIQYQTHIQNIGWENGWKSNGELSGTEGNALRLEAVKIRLTGEMAEHYDVYYRVHAQNFGWLNWAKNGQPAGTEGHAYRLEAMQIVLTDKGGTAPSIAPDTQKDVAFVEKYKDNVKKDSLITYQTHVQNVGWQNYAVDGGVAGTSGKSLRLEGMKINFNNPKYTGDIEYRTHIQNIGWENEWKKNNAMSGTEGRSLRLEAMEVKLTGEMAEHYDIYYRVHAQNFGWLGWAKNGESAGTAGYGYRLEGMQIVLVEKGKTPEQMSFASNTGTRFVWK